MEELRKAQEALKHAAHAYGIKALAPELDKAPSTLYDELSLSSEAKAKLGFAEAVRILAVTGDHTALRIVASALGYTISPADLPMPNRPTVEGECLDDYPSLLAAHALIIDGEHPVTVEQRFEAHFQECRETIAAYRMAWARKGQR